VKPPEPVLGTHVDTNQALRFQLRRSFPSLSNHQVDQLTQSLAVHRPSDATLDPVAAPDLPPSSIIPRQGARDADGMSGLIQEDAYFFESQEGSVLTILHVAFRRPNVFLSPDMYLFDLPGSDDYVKAADTYLADQFIYASAYPFTPLRDYAERFLKLPIRPESMQKVLYDNAARILKLPPG